MNMENNRQYRENFGETTVKRYDSLLTAKEMSRQMMKEKKNRKNLKNGKVGETVEAGKMEKTGILSKSVQFLEKLKKE